jgi:hypothetical protein
MYSESFKFILHDTTYSATATLGPQQSLTVKLLELPAFFTPYQEGRVTSEYILRQRRFSISYSKTEQTLEFFMEEDSHMSDQNIMQSILQNLESTLGAIRLHELSVSAHMEQVVQELATEYDIRLEALTHTSSSVVLTSPISQTTVVIKTEVSYRKDDKPPYILSMAANPKMLSTTLVEAFYVMRRPIAVGEVLAVRSMQSICKTSEVYLAIDETLGFMCQQAMSAYVPGSFTGCGFTVTASDFDDIRVSYMKQ